MSLTRLDSGPDPRPEEILVVAVLRNEMLRLPAFLAHHRKLGVDRFLMIDNGSDDGSTAFLKEQPDICLYFTDASYGDSRCGVDWQNAVLAKHAVGHWVLIVDIDEFLIFPGYETTPLHALTGWLGGLGAQAMVAPMLDMYPDGPIGALDYTPGTDLIAACPCFDATGYSTRTLPNGLSVLHRGGPRKRLFWDGRAPGYPAPVLEKIPLVHWREDRVLEASTHRMTGAALAPMSGLLLHFKFLQDFAAAAAQEVARAEHFRGARQYVAYDAVLGGAPDLDARGPQSARFEHSGQLTRLGLMQIPQDYPFPLPDGTQP